MALIKLFPIINIVMDPDCSSASLVLMVLILPMVLMYPDGSNSPGDTNGQRCLWS